NVKLSLLALFIGSFLTLMACENPESKTASDKVEDARDDLSDAADETSDALEDMRDDAKKWTAEKAEEFRNSINSTSSKLDKKIAELEDEMDDASDDAKVKYEEAIDRLKELKKNVDDYGNDISSDAAEKWENFKN